MNRQWGAQFTTCVDHYSGNLLAAGGRATHSLPIAVNDSTGKWRVAVIDLLTSQRIEAVIEVYRSIKST